MIRQFYIEPVYNRFYYVLLTIYETIDEIIVILLVGKRENTVLKSLYVTIFLIQ